MNTDVLDKPIVLSLDRAWQVIGHRTVNQALALDGGAAGLPPALSGKACSPPAEPTPSSTFNHPLPCQ